MNVTEQVRVIGRRVGHLLTLAVLAAFLVAAEDSCAGEKESPPEEDTSYPGMTITVEKGPADTPSVTEEPRVTEPAEAADLAALEYLGKAEFLLFEASEILDDYMSWMDDVVFEYELGVMFPDTAAGESALDRMKDVAGRVESLDPPAAFQKSYDLWLAACKEMVAGMELGVAGVEQLEPPLIDQGTAHVRESTRLMGLANDALERAE